MDSNTASSLSSPHKYAAKEVFVTGHDGTNPFEIFILCLAIPIGLRLHSKLITTLLPRRNNAAYDGRGTSTNYWMEVVIEFATLILPNLILQTSLLPYLVGPIVLLATMTILSFIIPVRSSTTKSSSSSSQTEINNKRPPFLTVHRAAVYIQTAIAILAVDFPIFPRRYCKTEVIGYGWMDLGAASFIIIAGWSSAAATNATSSSSSTAASDSISSAVAALKRAVIKCTPLVILGIIRLITIKGVEYQEHVSEYGVHWNFFFTLCCVEGCMVLWKFVKLTTRQQKYWTDASLACQLLINYQLYLSLGGGQDFIENGSRYCGHNEWLCNVYVANREGILGIIGYLGLRLMSESMARYCIWITTTKVVGEESKSSSMTAAANLHSLRQRRLFISSVFCWIVHFFLTFVLGVPNSRRSTNVSFIMWSLAQNTSQLCLIHFVMTREYSSDPAPRIFNCINRFGLPVFFTSNILTGLINLLVDTIHSSDRKAILVLSIYLGAVCGLALVLEKIKDMRLTRKG